MDSVSVQIFEEFDGLVSERFLGRVAQLTLEHEQIERSLSLVIADDDTVRELNRTYRGLDQTTDVLSFAFDNQGEYYGEGSPPSDWTEDVEFILPTSVDVGLGEVIISYPQALRQATEAGRDVNDELAHLTTHGILHLLGHDHMVDAEQEVMAAKETAILAEALGALNE
ncbi:MAG: rRNA maturation RNase YbeY [SAR202 cluster bacterium Casp-Chloro-G4]|nr:rRNA maturation RNase YbeY [Chloroflexota bacterium]MDA1227285.1 rRNA maturation RNase YbeY [Chloroflexota bacterium]PKB61105.1 MAG: rRNA maturation RNase YbeY [SAR202 cluster bacterium Casp-Chloro-G4]